MRDALSRRLMRAVVPVLARLVGTVVTRPHVRTAAQATYREVANARAAFIDLAEAQYNSMTGTGRIERPALREYTAVSWERALLRTWDRTVSRARPVSHEDVAAALVTADHQGRDAERAQLVAYAMNDEQVVGWARVDFKPPTCPFCTMLISRGPVYSTSRTAGGRNKFHHGDTCSVVLVTESTRDSYPGVEHTREAEREWIEAGRGSASGGETLDKLRKAHADRAGRGNPGTVGARAESVMEQETST